MKKQLLLCLACLIPLISLGQENFVNGYFINDIGQKVDCLINAADWKNNPTTFEYRLTNSSEIVIGTIDKVEEFGVYGAEKFIRVMVDIDRSSQQMSKLSSMAGPEFQQETLFLSVLVEGKATLYSYKEQNFQRFFYSTKEIGVTQLIYKKYKKPNDEVGNNDLYRQQILNDLKCSNLTKNKVRNLEYKKNKLMNFFVEYSKCHDEEYMDFFPNRKKVDFNLHLRPGINSSSFSYKNDRSIAFGGSDLDNELSFRFGLEAEFFFPQKEKKWSVLLEPTYQSYTSSTVLDSETITLDYSSIEFPLGIRRYFSLSDSSRIFANASFVFDLPMDSAISYDSNRDDLAISDLSSNLAFGLGYSFRGVYSMELRLHTDRDILIGYTFWNSNYKTVSFILGYSIF